MPNRESFTDFAIQNIRRIGGEKLVLEIVRIFIRQAGQKWDELNRALDARDFSGVERAAHSLKSSAANVGALALSAICARVEEAANQSDQSTIIAKKAQLQKETDKAIEHFTEYLKGKTP